MSTSKKNHIGSRRGLSKENREKVAREIVDSYHATIGCPPLSTHWGGHDLGKTDWLKKFAEEVVDDQSKSLEAWNTVKEKCDTSFIIELLYLLTLRERVTLDRHQDAYHALVAEIEKVTPRYDKLLEDVLTLTENPLFSPTMPYVRGSLAKVCQRLQESKSLLEELRDANIEHSSYKRSARDWYLFLLATALINATGRPHVEELATLLDAARFANNERCYPADVATLNKRIQRWTKYVNAKVIDGRMMFRINTRNTSSQENGSDDPMPF